MDNFNDINLINNPLRFFEAIKNIKEKEKKYQVLIEISKKHNIDICLYAVKAIEGGFDAFLMNMLIVEVIGDIKLNKESLYVYLSLLSCSVQDPFFSYPQYRQIQIIASKQEDFAYEFLEYLQAIDEPLAFQYIKELILCINKINNEEKHSDFLLMVESGNEIKIICGLNGLGRLNYSPDDDIELINETLKLFDTMLIKNVQSINIELSRALGNMFSLGDEIINRIVSLSENKDPFILLEISEFLFRYRKVVKDKLYFNKLLLSLTNIKCEYLRENNNIDMLLSSILEEDDNIYVVLDFILKWISNGNCSISSILDLQLLDMTLCIIYSKNTIFQKALLALFNNDNIIAPQLATCIITKNYSRNDRINFDLDIITDLSNDDIIFIFSKILSCNFLPEILCSLICSLLLGKKHNTIIVDFLSDCFAEYIGFNYPETTIKALNEMLDILEDDENIASKINNILIKINEIKKTRYNNCKLKELVPSRKDCYLLYKEEWSQSQRTIEKAEGSSKLIKLLSKSHVKYGKSTSHYYNENISESEPFKCISYSFELAYNSCIDPVYHCINLNHFQNMKKGEI